MEDHTNETKLINYSLIQWEEKRLARNVLLQHKHYKATGDNWYKIFEEIINTYNIDANEEKTKEITKTAMKKDIKSKTTNKVFERLDEKRLTMKKLRFIKQGDAWNQNSYIQKYS